MSANDVPSASPIANPGIDPPPLTPHSQPPLLRLASPPPAALVTLAEAASALQTPVNHTRSHTPPTAATHTPPTQPAFEFPQTNGHAAPLANDRPAENLVPPGLNPLPPLGDIMPSSSNPIVTSSHPPAPHQAPALPATSENDDQVASSADDDDDDDDDDNDNDNDSDGEEQQQPMYLGPRWRPIVECTSEPCQDELDHIVSKGEHSAKDVEYWEKQTFFQVDDPEIVMGESGRIDFTITYNGTKEKPNKKRVMHSDVVRIGGYEWRIKFYPRGDNSSYLSCYVECVSMRTPQSEEALEFQSLPFPQLAGEKKELKPRRSVAAQIGVVMYNPAEPRVNEFQTDAHQYKHKSADYGWQKFSREYYDTFHLRTHGQRAAMLRKDTLAFTAFIRVVHDPTGYLWLHESRGDPKSFYSSSIAITGLRPFVFHGSELPATAALLHIPLFRSIIYQTKSRCRAVHLLQVFLMKMLSRECSDRYGDFQETEMGDVVSSLQWYVAKLADGCEESEAKLIRDVIGSLHPEDGHAVGSNRLKTKNVRSLNEALAAHSSAIPLTTLLTLELQRQEFDTRLRKWKRIVNKVEMDEVLQIGDTQYSLFAYATHSGALSSNKHTLYVRPRGVGTLWYGYRGTKVIALTHQQAAGTHCGVNARKVSCKPSRAHSPLRLSSEHAREEVAYVALYLKAGQEHFDFPNEEVWPNIPARIAKGRVHTTDPETWAVAEGADWDASPEHVRATSNTNGGSETPQWHMDGDDVVMSDAEDNDVSSQVDPLAASVQLASTATAEPPTGPSMDIYEITEDALGRDYYNGTKLGHMRHGTGHLITMSGDEYRGEFQHNVPHGKGTMLYASSGSTYVGTWHMGEHHGEGTLTESSGNKYVGGWEYGRRRGPFTITGLYTDEDRSSCNVCYCKDITTAFHDCGHVLACHDCAAKMNSCPVCRKRILARVQLFGVRIVMD